MKKRTITSLLLLSLLLAACGTAQTARTVTSGSATAEALPAASQLILGTFKLEGTDHPVSAEQAAQLLPLWQVYKELRNSDTAAQAEVEALVKQIQETMTSSQVKAIDAMSLSPSDLATVIAEQKVVEAAPLANRSTTISSGAAQGGPAGDVPPRGYGRRPGDGGGRDAARQRSERQCRVHDRAAGEFRGRAIRAGGCVDPAAAEQDRFSSSQY